MIYLKRRAQRLAPDAATMANGSGRNIVNLNARDNLIQNEAELRNAEAQLTGSILEMREKLLENFELYDRYSTMRGYTGPYMHDIELGLQRQGIAAEVLFQETAPLGVAASVVSQQGFFELYIERGRRQEADRLIQTLLKN